MAFENKKRTDEGVNWLKGHSEQMSLMYRKGRIDSISKRKAIQTIQKKHLLRGEKSHRIMNIATVGGDSGGFKAITQFFQ